MTWRATLLLLLFAIFGCSSSAPTGGGQEPTGEAILHEVGAMLQSYSGEAHRGPKKAADLSKFENSFPLGYRAVQSGDVVVVWGAPIAGEGDAKNAPADVVAYEKKVPNEGGWVLLQNGNVKQMSGSEFAAAPKAK